MYQVSLTYPIIKQCQINSSIKNLVYWNQAYVYICNGLWIQSRNTSSTGMTILKSSVCFLARFLVHYHYYRVRYQPDNKVLFRYKNMNPNKPIKPYMCIAVKSARYMVTVFDKTKDNLVDGTQSVEKQSSFRITPIEGVPNIYMHLSN